MPSTIAACAPPPSGAAQESRLRAELAGALRGRAGGHACALVVELVALAEAGDDHPAPAVLVRHGDLAQAALRLAGLDERLDGVVVGRLALEHPDDARVGFGLLGGARAGALLRSKASAAA